MSNSKNLVDSPEPIELIIPLVKLNSPSSSSILLDDDHNIPFPSPMPDEKPSPDSQASSSSDASKLTSSDKLSALPSPSSPRIRPLNRSRNNINSTTSLPTLPTFDPSTPPQFGLATLPRTSVSDSSVGGGTPRQRISAESDRISLPTVQSIRQAFSRLHHSSSPKVSNHTDRSRKDSIDSPDSASHSRAASPLRILQNWSANLRSHPREDPFVPVNPFKPHFRLQCLSHPPTADPEHAALGCNCDDALLCCLAPPANVQQFLATAQVFLTYTLPRTIYLHLLLLLPSLYFSRVARIFEDAEVSRPDIQRMIDVCLVSQDSSAHGGNTAAGTGGMHGHGTLSPTPPSHTAFLPFPEDWNPPAVSPALARFKHSWEAFIDSLLREWKTLNVVSALLLTAILTMFQIPSTTDDPIIRTSAFLSLICALMSLCYGCIYIVRFGTMRSMHKASRWAEEARKTNTLIWWNVWVLLAMPAVWLAWSMLLFVTSILSFLWRTGSTDDSGTGNVVSPRAALGPRIAVTGVFAIGMVYFAMIVTTLTRYGSTLGERGRGRFATGGPGAVGGVAREREGEEVAAMENRGRRREPAAGARAVRREEAVRGRGEDADSKTAKDRERDRGGTGLRSVMGLGLTGMGDSVVEGDLEKGIVGGEGKGSSSS